MALLALSYFVSGVADEVTRGTSSGADFRQKPTAWSFIQLICNLTFIMWIQYSLERILKLLREQKQFAKLSMYRALAWSLAAFIVFFTILTVVAVCRCVLRVCWMAVRKLLTYYDAVVWACSSGTSSGNGCSSWRGRCSTLRSRRPCASSGGQRKTARSSPSRCSSR